LLEIFGQEELVGMSGIVTGYQGFIMLGAYQDSRPAPGGKPKVNFGMKDGPLAAAVGHGA